MRHLHTTRNDQEDGVVLVEFALVFALFATLLLGIFTYGTIFAVQQTVTHAAAEAARASVGYDDFADAQAAGNGAAVDQLQWLGTAGALKGTEMRLGDCVQPAGSDPYDGSPVDTGAALRCVFVKYSYPWASDPIVPSLLKIGTPTVITGTATITWDGSS